MASRVGFEASALAVYSAADHEEMPKGWLGDHFAGSGATVTTAPQDLVSVTVTVAANRKLMVSARGNYTAGASADTGRISVYEGATSLGRVHLHPSTLNESYGAGFVTINGPSAGSHTYKLVGETDAGTFDLNGHTHIFVEDVGPAHA